VIGWDHPATATRYERFYRRHARYRHANEVLAREAALVPGLRVLDVGAGTGQTAAAALPHLGRDGSIVCVEPAAAMRAAGMRRITDQRVAWRAEFPSEAESFERILCGAAIWQLSPLDEWIRRLAALLRPGGALCFDIPALYLGEPDEPGGGSDPLLLDLHARLASSLDVCPAPVPDDGWRHGASDIEMVLRSAGLEPHAWRLRVRITQTAWARWLTIPVLTDRLFPDVAPDERDRRIADALATVDRRSYKWERWRGWTAWKR
jgi:SAM-dependent methyltransferase